MAEKIIAETSARHVHLTAEHVDILFGKGHTLTHKKDLSQPGQFACEERVNVEGPKSTLKNVIILGPTRPATQVELSLTDARSIGITAPIRESGDIDGSASVKLIGPAGEVVIDEGAIAAKRHIHLTPESAAANGVSDKEIVMVKLDTARPLIFDDVVCRVSEKFAPAFHMDTDESNAAAASGVVYCEIIKK
ncbi:MAG: phosphate propanoyltransferase [Clostridia bacterium]|nr:phosphate propanoyltransferase [Clostridia bacterium]